MLLNKGADISVVDDNGKRPFDMLDMFHENYEKIKNLFDGSGQELLDLQ